MQELNVATERYPENSDSGLMICGINWGGSEDDATQPCRRSFFSDRTVNCYPYRDRLLVWFNLLGHRLETQAGKEGGFERSIVQTNWLDTQSPNMRGKSLYDECISNWENMEPHLIALRPRLIMFLSVSLLDSLNSTELTDRVKGCLGDSERPRYMRKEIVLNGRRLRRFRIAIQEYEKASVIALPHPTGSTGLSNEYIAHFKPDLSPYILTFKESRGFNT